MSSSSHEASARQRNRSILAFFATSVAARGVGIGCQFFQVPFALHSLGSEAFGLWMSLGSLSFLLTFADFGVGLGAQNQMAEAFGVEDRLRAQKIFFTSLTFLSLIAVILLACLVPVCLFLDWRGLLKLTEPGTINQVGMAALVVAGCCCAGLPLGLAQRLAFSAQLGWINNVSQCAASLVTSGAVIAAAAYHLSFAAYILAAWLPLSIINLLQLVWLLYRLDWLRPRRDLIERARLRGLLGVGALFSVGQICGIIVTSAPVILLSATLGAAAVTPFNLTQRVFNLFLVIANALMQPLWPAYAAAKARRDWTWLQRTLWRSLAATFALTVLPMAIGAVFMREALQFWTRSQTGLPDGTLVLLLFIWNALMVIQQPFSTLLAGVSQIKRLTLYSVCATTLCVGMMVWLAPIYGSHGVVLGMIIAGAPFAYLATVRETARFFRKVRAEEASATAAGGDEMPAGVPVLSNVTPIVEVSCT